MVKVDRSHDGAYVVIDFGPEVQDRLGAQLPIRIVLKKSQARKLCEDIEPIVKARRAKSRKTP